MLFRLSILSSPLLLFVYATVGVKLLSPSESLQFISALATSHLLGALPGIALGLAHTTNSETFNRSNKTQFALAFTFVSLASFATSQQSIAAASLSASAFIATYFDLLSKKLNPKLIIKNRLGQSGITIILLALIALYTSSPTANQFILGRALVNSTSLISLAIIALQATPKIEIKAKSFKIKNTIYAYIWMAGSNSIFLIPSLPKFNISNDSSLIITAYLIQTSLQLSGRLSDYLTLGALHHKKISAKESIAIGLVIFSFLIVTAIATGAKNNGNWMLAFTITSLSLSILLWGYGDSKYSTQLFQGKKYPTLSTIAGTSSAILTGSIVAIGIYIPQPSPAILMLTATLVGSANYAFFAKKKS